MKKSAVMPILARSWELRLDSVSAHEVASSGLPSSIVTSSAAASSSEGTPVVVYSAQAPSEPTMSSAARAVVVR